MEVEVSSAEFHAVGKVLVVVQVESRVDSIFVDDQAIRLNVVSSHQVVALEAVLVVVLLTTVVLVVLATSVLVVITGEELAESVAVVLHTAGLFEFSMELVVAVVTVGDVLSFLSLVVMIKSVVGIVRWGVMIDGVLNWVSILVLIAARLVMDWYFVVLVWLKDGLKGHAVGGECITGSIGFEAKHASGKDGCGEVHLFSRYKKV